MDDKITIFHRVILWIGVVSWFVFGFGHYLAPTQTTTFLKVNAPDSLAISTVGGFLIAAFVGAVFSLKSGSWQEVRITTYYLITWNLLNGIRITWHIIKTNETPLLPNAIISLVIGLGLLYVAYRRKCTSKT